MSCSACRCSSNVRRHAAQLRRCATASAAISAPRHDRLSRLCIGHKTLEPLGQALAGQEQPRLHGPLGQAEESCYFTHVVALNRRQYDLSRSLSGKSSMACDSRSALWFAAAMPSAVGSGAVALPTARAPSDAGPSASGRSPTARSCAPARRGSCSGRGAARIGCGPSRRLPARLPRRPGVGGPRCTRLGPPSWTIRAAGPRTPARGRRPVSRASRDVWRIHAFNYSLDGAGRRPV